MSKYECPNCDGGFPEPGPENECPWCGQALDKSYTDGDSRGLFDNDGIVIQPNLGSSSSGGADLDVSQKPTGMTECPECGDPMPMVTWTGEKPKCRECSKRDRLNNELSIGGDTA